MFGLFQFYDDIGNTRSSENLPKRATQVVERIVEFNDQESKKYSSSGQLSFSSSLMKRHSKPKTSSPEVHLKENSKGNDKVPVFLEDKHNGRSLS